MRGMMMMNGGPKRKGVLVSGGGSEFSASFQVISGSYDF